MTDTYIVTIEGHAKETSLNELIVQTRFDKLEDAETFIKKFFGDEKQMLDYAKYGITSMNCSIDKDPGKYISIRQMLVPLV